MAFLASSGNLSAQVTVNDLHDEIDAGRVRFISATGNGSSSGASVEGYLINDTAVRANPDADVTVAAQLAIWLVQGVDTAAIRSKFEFTPADERLARTFIQ